MFIEQIRSGVYHVNCVTQYELTSMFMRLQEFYESPIRNFKGRFFKHEEYFDAYANVQKDKQFTYFDDWSGFNVPDEVIKKFWELFQHDLWKKEFDLMRMILLDSDSPYYVIGTYGKSDSGTIQHELAHAYWYLYPEYRDEMMNHISSMNVLKSNTSGLETKLEIIQNVFMDNGYDVSVLNDETQAYLATSSRGYLKDTFGEAFNDIRIPSSFKKTFKEFDKIQLEKVINGGKL